MSDIKVYSNNERAAEKRIVTAEKESTWANPQKVEYDVVRTENGTFALRSQEFAEGGEVHMTYPPKNLIEYSRRSYAMEALKVVESMLSQTYNTSLFIRHDDIELNHIEHPEDL